MAGTEAASAVDREAEYYRTVEEFFVSRRGDPLFLSNADWLLIRDWRRAGLPLRIVLRGISDALDAHAHSWSRDRKVGSLRYCAAEVQAARERWERAVSEGESAIDLEERLDQIDGALAGATGLGPAASRRAASILEALRERRATAGLRPREWDTLLASEEGRLLADLEAQDAALLPELESQVEAELAPYRRRMPEGVARQIRKDAVARRLLAAHSLPRLSVFQI
jgi:hypothetical protein